MMSTLTCLLLLSVLSLSVLLLTSAPAVPGMIASVEIYEIDQLSAVNISHLVPTGSLNPSEILQLNLPRWARNVTQHSLDAVKVVGLENAQWADIQRRVASVIDPDLTVQMCSWLNSFANLTACSINITSTEDHNRYLDLRVTWSSFGRFPISTFIRLVVAEDASKAVNVPLSFDVLAGRL